MAKETIRVFYKRPGKNLVEVKIPNELEWIQGAVEGHVEAITLRESVDGLPAVMLLCNEEGKLRGMAHNFRINYRGVVDNIVGPVLFVGADGEEFTDCPMSRREMETWLRLLGYGGMR